MSNDAAVNQAYEQSIARATAALQSRSSAVQSAQETPAAPTPPTPSQTVTEVARTIVQKAQADGAPPAEPEAALEEAAKPEVSEAQAAKRAEQERRLQELRAKARAKREEMERAQAAEQARREAEARQKAIDEREARLKEQEAAWKRTLGDPMEGFKQLGIQPEVAFAQIAKAMTGRNEKVELTAAQWEEVQRKLAEVEEQTKGAKPDPAEQKRLEELENRVRQYEAERQRQEYQAARQAAEDKFIGVVRQAVPELLVEYGDRLTIDLADQLANSWVAQGYTTWNYEELALELKKHHDAHEQARAERRAKYLKPESAPNQLAGNSGPPQLKTASSQESGGSRTATQTLSNDLSATTSAGAKTKLTREEREALATQKLQARMNAAKR